jgi:hypothetical protein
MLDSRFVFEEGNSQRQNQYGVYIRTWLVSWLSWVMVEELSKTESIPTSKIQGVDFAQSFSSRHCQEGRAHEAYLPTESSGCWLPIVFMYLVKSPKKLRGQSCGKGDEALNSANHAAPFSSSRALNPFISVFSGTSHSPYSPKGHAWT